ncbi:helix-turn-helix transcriptional regulator [Virgisporangium ochraceum]|uniref:Transcriptional regulator n=1 Tax=Virgisporangium ochraceum TaxID=65505 RepID=A0A8J3ZUQ4_9ACTN|nr:transcriptional regulator [Virgisporangium ochraceum]GIJ69453.1 transcriptional regulator [Virgisporangium ochraceum]
MTVDAIGLLHEPVRRAVYEYVAAQSGPVGRDAVAGAVGIGRTLAAFHLDKLADAGLLAVSFARRAGRTGRPAKLYRRAADELAVSVPPRQYRMLAGALAEALEETGADAAAYAAAYRRGRAQPFPDDPEAQLETHLEALGYEPFVDGACIRLRNCPFGTVAEEFPPLVCGMNLGLVRGMLAGGGLPESLAELDPASEGCCVKLSRSRP